MISLTILVETMFVC